MRNNSSCPRLVVPLLGVALAALLGPGANAGEPVWETSWKVARQQAVNETRPILVNFTASWCVPCHAMDRDFWPLSEVRAELDRFVLVTLDYDASSGLRHKLGVEGIPNVIVVDPWENVLGRRKGWGGDPRPHLELLRALPRDFQPLAEDLRAASGNEADGSTLERLGERFYSASLAEACRSFLERAVRSPELKDQPERLSVAISKIGWCELWSNVPAAARKSFEKALGIAGERSDLALAGLAVSWTYLEKHERAEPILEELRDRHPGSEHLAKATAIIEAARSRPRGPR